MRCVSIVPHCVDLVIIRLNCGLFVNRYQRSKSLLRQKATVVENYLMENASEF